MLSIHQPHPQPAAPKASPKKPQTHHAAPTFAGAPKPPAAAPSKQAPPHAVPHHQRHAVGNKLHMNG